VHLESNFTATQLFLMAREAVHNAVKHAQPRKIVIRLEAADGKDLRLRITDDGTGISEENREAGMGLHIMQYRCNLLGGILDVSPGKSGGTSVTCTVPSARSKVR
jgi:two-component system CheB/CheR fusion protein